MARPPAPWLTTLRLAMREFVPDDYDDLCRLDSDPRVMRFVTGKPATRDETHATMRRVTRYYDRYPDLGVWYTTRRDTGTFIGWFSLKYCGKSPDVEIGYRLLPEAWGQGFATEGATAMHATASTTWASRIIGVTHPGNLASQHVLHEGRPRDRGWGRYYDRRLRLFAADSPYRAHEPADDAAARAAAFDATTSTICMRWTATSA